MSQQKKLPVETKLLTVTERTGCIQLPGQLIPIWYLDEHNILLFDSGMASTHQIPLLDCLSKHRLTPRGILTSHAHVDHSGNHAFLQKRFSAQIWMSTLDAALSHSPEALMLLYPNMGRNDLLQHASEMLTPCNHLIAPDMDYIVVEGETIQVLPLPGHTPGHIGFVLPDGVAYLGDLLLSQSALHHMQFPFSLCWSTDIVSKQRALHLPYTTSIIAHNEVCHDLPALVNYNLSFLYRTMCHLLNLIQPMDTLVDVLHRLYANRSHKSHPSLWSVLEVTLRAYLSYLVDVDCLELTQHQGAIHVLPTGSQVPIFYDSYPKDHRLLSPSGTTGKVDAP